MPSTRKLFPSLIAAIWFLLLGSLTFATTDLTILAMNTNFLFDHLQPHGRVVGAGNGPPVPTATQWQTRARGFAQRINAVDADLVGLVEIENDRVVDEIRQHLTTPSEWTVVFAEGRDSYTGQDVALLTKFAPLAGTVTTFPDEREIYFQGSNERTVNPSKVLGVTLRIENQEFYVIVAHLISRRGNNDAKRLGQANVLRRHVVMAMLQGQNVIMMGDFNDTPGTPVLRRLRGFDDIWGSLIQTANEVHADERFTYVYNGEENLLDHILLSPSLYQDFRRMRDDPRSEIIDLGDLSDHHGVAARIRVQ